jgi:hypothetical protein
VETPGQVPNLLELSVEHNKFGGGDSGGGDASGSCRQRVIALCSPALQKLDGIELSAAERRRRVAQPAAPQPPLSAGASDGGGGGGGEGASAPPGLPTDAPQAAAAAAAGQQRPLSPRIGTARGRVSPFLACIGSPCLRHCVHGAPIGGAAQAPQLPARVGACLEDSGRDVGVGDVEWQGWRQGGAGLEGPGGA